MKKHLTRLSVFQKFGILLATILIVLSVTIYFNQRSQIIESNNERMESHLQDIHNLFDLQLKEKQEQVNAALAVAREIFISKGALREIDSLHLEIAGVDQVSKQVHQIKLKSWYLGNTPLVNNFEVVDKIQELTGQTATIFQKIDGGYLRISTNVRKLDGERAVGTFIPNDSEVIKAVERGETYRGRAFVVNAWYVTAYEPINIDGKIKGMLYVGVQEKDLSFLKEKFYEKVYQKTGYPYALTNEGELLIHKTREGEQLAGQSEVKKILEQKQGMLTLPWGGKEGQSMVHFLKFHDFYGITVGIAIPEDEIFSEPLEELRIIMIGGFCISLALMLVMVNTTADSVVNPLKKVNESLKLLAQRKPIIVDLSDRNDELGEINRSLYQVAEGMTQVSAFANEIGRGNLEADFSAIDEADTLGNSLLQMRHELKKVATEERRRMWFNEGIALFSDLTRKYNNELEELCQQSLNQLVKYINANQGAFYMLEEPGYEPAYLELKCCYAYGRVKYLNQKIQLNESLTGQVVLEKDYIYLTDVPKNYVKITSGLGEATPGAIIILPLINNDKVQGVLELAFFKQMETHEIEFLQKIAENLASSVSSVKVNEVTKRLLNETQKMAEEIGAQEEELRQNTEELKATQEELTRQMREVEKENTELKSQLQLNH